MRRGDRRRETTDRQIFDFSRWMGISLLQNRMLHLSVLRAFDSEIDTEVSIVH